MLGCVLEGAARGFRGLSEERCWGWPEGDPGCLARVGSRAQGSVLGWTSCLAVLPLPREAPPTA